MTESISDTSVIKSVTDSIISKVDVGPKIYEVFKCCKNDNVCYTGFVMDKLKITLYDFITKHNPTKKQLKIIYEAVKYKVNRLHKAGIYHHDLHLRNIMLDYNNIPYIIDYGNSFDIISLEPSLEHWSNNIISLISSFNKW